ncbi:superoxide dismutase [Fe] 3, chloroplastic isoform X3 [Hevea brasiliensis]|uniref:superoxide dismutase [Fe] 3, chloroplastic isoform X3 n=1 Tax=Hevea brasiliensis TaxID=3981 RepID=UPI0025F8D049|nr:superoxide dismutase [Fe] 3, chloroplastic isoform X3 [Hevea brasiliensis]
MSWCCTYNPLPLYSRLQVTDFSCSWQLKNAQKMLLSLGKKPEKKKQFYRFQTPSKVVAYYRLKTPPYKLDALEPYMSKRTLEMHWEEHHRAYVEGLNKQLANDDILYGYTMDELVKVTYNNGNPLPEFNNAAQVWNHDFFWESMQPGGGEMPELGVLQQIEKDFGSYTNFKEKFTESAFTVFGSGWIWLVSHHLFRYVGGKFILSVSLTRKNHSMLIIWITRMTERSM